MAKTKIIIEEPVTIGDQKIIPVVQTCLNKKLQGKNIFMLFTKQPVAIVIVTRTSKRFFRINGKEISLEELAKEVPEIKKIFTS